MTHNLKKVLVFFVVAALSTMQFGCGDDETNAPAVKLTASTVSSSATNAHQHNVSIPFVDISAAPVAGGYQYRSDTVNGHSHVIALSQLQVVDLNNGMQLTLVSSVPNLGTSHTHTWGLQGGSVLYEMNCYNCHSNDKRGQNPMNVSFNASQTSAVKSPGTQPTSTSPAAIPDPNYVPSTTSTLVDAVSLYASRCAGCHSLGTIDSVQGIGPNLSAKGALVNVKFPTPGVTSHNGLSLTSTEITAMISYLNAN
jgi:mono/diheme cytochrome c family protein